MIFSNLQDTTAKSLQENNSLDRVFEFLNDKKLKALSVGKYNLTDTIFAKVQEYSTKKEEKGRWESHKKYADFQYIISGTEFIKVTKNSQLSVKSNELEAKDALYYEKFQGPSSQIKLGPDDFVILFPEDAHEACLNVEGSVDVKKAVIKIPIDYFLN
ncbi:DUF386 domain-containing protein [Lactiplantibacillus pentosus]|uniref:YhcH/YjgK/YiaL family protein n=1 Tax=Lactiplantibacillus pentosus TaxID=1589 RepID=UPI000D01A712|nr:YhcH/YjgK/YiaL family protein [Lactiplantibacillus pentosus]PRO93540.1 DUF386 domain-containing protein [Lactiplantibacillus pentosus]